MIGEILKNNDTLISLDLSCEKEANLRRRHVSEQRNVNRE